MSSPILLAKVWPVLEALIVTTWPEVTAGYEAMQASRLNWRDALAEGSLEAPWAIVRPMPMQVWEEGPISQPYYKMRVEITYVASSKLSDANALLYDRAMQLCEAKCLDLADALYSGSHLKFQVMDMPTVDCSDEAMVNSYMLSTGAPFVSGTIAADLIVSELYGSDDPPAP